MKVVADKLEYDKSHKRKLVDLEKVYFDALYQSPENRLIHKKNWIGVLAHLSNSAALIHPFLSFLNLLI